MSFLVPITLFGWIPVVLALFALLPPRRAVIVSFLFAWLFLPMAGYSWTGLPDYTKMSATCWGVLLAVAIFDPNRLFRFRFRWFDLPMLVWCLLPLVISPMNGLGIYDGVAWSFRTITAWGFPYFIGRIYFNDSEGVRALAIGILVGGLIYVPFCLYEIRMSPQLHDMLYGFRQNQFGKNVRLGGYRPTVFMQSGLAVGLWMASASLIGVWLWTTKSLRQLWGAPLGWMLPVLLVTTVLCKALTALGLMLMGIGALFAFRWTRVRMVLVALVAVAPLYMVVRATDLWSGDQLVGFAEIAINERRASSLDFRMANEDVLVDRAWGRPLLGWGRFGRNRPPELADEELDVTTDGLWIIVFGQRGLLGLASITLVLLLPAVLLIRRFPPASWYSPALAPAAALVLLPVLYMIDCLFNAMVNPIYMLAVGGLVAFAGRHPLADRTRQHRARAVRQPAAVRPEQAGLARQPTYTHQRVRP